MYCATCGNNCPPTGCQKVPFQWGFDGCLLRARLNGLEVKPLNFCKWLYCHQTDTKLRLIPNGSDSYLEYLSENDINPCDSGVQGESDKIYICDLLGLGQLNCIGDTSIVDAKPCDILVYHPWCGDADCEDCNLDRKNKWVNYHIPDAGDCEVQPDENGFYKVLVKDKCGCIKECRLKNTDDAYQYHLRDSVANDPDWPFTYGNFAENIDLQLQSKVPRLFGHSDLEVQISFSYGVQQCNAGRDLNFKSIVIPVIEGTPADSYNHSIITQLGNLKPWGSWEANATRTILVPKGKNLILQHSVSVRRIDTAIHTTAFDGQSYDGKGAAKADSSRLHALTVTVKPVRRHIV